MLVYLQRPCAVHREKRRSMSLISPEFVVSLHVNDVTEAAPGVVLLADLCICSLVGKWTKEEGHLYACGEVHVCAQ